MKRAMYDGAPRTDACRVSSYSLQCCDAREHHIENSCVESKWECAIHGRGCIGHLVTNSRRTITLLPSSLVPNSDEIVSVHQRNKDRVWRGTMDTQSYSKATSKMMMGKKGLIRSLMSMRVEGTAKMVISVAPSGTEGTIEVPEQVCDNIKIPCFGDDKVVHQNLNDGDWALLVRQPCLWSGSIQPVRVRRGKTCSVTHNKVTWNTNMTMKLPPEMCSPYAADFDGDEMTLFPLKNPQSIRECEMFHWNYGTLSDEGLHQQLVPRSSPKMGTGFNSMCIRSTISWTDKDNHQFKVTDAHKACHLSFRTYMSIESKHANPLEFALKATKSMTLAGSKSALQSDVGALSRRSKLGAERIFISPSGCMTYMSVPCSVPIKPRFECNSLITRANFGNPCVRAISKLTSRLMQITLKIKSDQFLTTGSPCMTLLSGSSPWPVIHIGGKISMQSYNQHSTQTIESTPSIWQIAQCDESDLTRLSVNCILMCVAETRAELDPSEFEALVCLCRQTCSSKNRSGVSVVVFDKDPSMLTIWRWGSCYYDGLGQGICTLPRFAESSIERRMIYNFDFLPSICHEFRNPRSQF